jgi:hypothetical protein
MRQPRLIEDLDKIAAGPATEGGEVGRLHA